MNSSGHEISGYRWVVMGAWVTSSVAGFMVVSTLGILMPSISADLGLSPCQQGLLGSAAFWGNLLLAIPLSWWTSRYGPKALTTTTLILGTLFIFIQGVAPAFIVLIIARLAFGVSTLAREPARAYLIRQWFPQNEIVIANSVSNVMFGVVVGGGLIVTPIILNNFGDDWRTVFLVYGGAFTLLTLIWMILGRERLLNEPKRQSNQPERNVVKIALSHGDVWVAGLGFCGAALSWAAFLSFYPTLMLDTYDMPLSWSGAVMALGIFIGGLSGLAAGFYVSAKGRRKVLLQAFGVIMVGSYLGLLLTDSIPILIVMTSLNGIAWGFFPILYTVPFLISGIRSREIAIGVSFLGVAMSAGSVAGPLITGFLQEALQDLRTALLIVSFAGLSLSLAGILLRFGNKDASAQAIDHAMGDLD